MAQSNWPIGKTYPLGSKQFSEKEIIEFARTHDPLPFHLSKQEAKESRFKGLVCSGSQAFFYFYVKAWLPLFGQSVEAGLGMSEWKFLAPVYENESIKAQCTLIESRATKDPKFCVNKWHFEFLKEKKTKEKVQYLYLEVMHLNSAPHV
ncbi:MAG: MaoC/PaaZ C-terminal domain-containing protein [Vicingaceae bacterium]